jgi:histidinol-phosphate/aromatic aminotransferase/cobyric acid decarboxylase-like protein
MAKVMKGQQQGVGARVSEKLTEWEWRALKSEWNLADGHARQSPTPDELHVWRGLFADAIDILHASQSDIEDEFLANFMQLNGQSRALSLFQRPLLHYSSSITIEVIANLGRIENWQVDLVTPTFDNIADIFKRQDVPLRPVAEEDILGSPGTGSGDTLFVTIPNNPTAIELSRDDWVQLLSTLSLNKIRLIVDASFRLLGNEDYKFLPSLLHDSGIDFVVIEDTGKYFSTLDLKCGMCWCSDALRPRLIEITNDLLLNVSPLALKLVARLSRLHFEHPVNKPAALLRNNYQRVLEGLSRHGIEDMTARENFSVLWARLPRSASGDLFCEALATQGLVILPGSSFYWHDDEAGSDFVRFALMRDEAYVASAMAVFDRYAEDALRAAR